MNRMKRRFAFLSVMGLVGGLAAMPSWGITATWTPTTAGPHSWNVNTNPPWTGGVFPNAVDDVANLNINIAANQTVNLNQAITVGTLNLGDTSGAQTQTIAPNGGSLTFDVSAGNAALTKDAGGTGTATITAAITLNDNLVVTNNSSGDLFLRGGMNNNGFNITFDGSGRTRLQDAIAGISGSGNVIKNGSGLLILGNGGTNPTHTYTGRTIVNGGSVMFQAANKAAGNFTLNNGMLTDYYRNTTIFSGGLGDGDNQIQIYGDSGFGGGNGNSNWRIGAQNSVLQWGSTFFNPTSLKFLVPGADNMGTSIYGQVTLQNGLDLNGGARTIQVSEAAGANAITNSWARITGVISGATGSLVKTGGGNLRLQGANTYGGGTTINAGSLIMENASALGSTSGALTVNTGGTLNLNNQNLTVGNLTGTGGTITNDGANARTLTIGNGDATGGNFQGSIVNNTNGGTGTLALTKTGTGVLTLSGINTYTGATTVNAGSLYVNGSLGNSNVTINNGGTFGGSGSILGTITLNAGGTLAPGSSIESLVSGSNIWNGGSTYEFEFMTDGSGVAGVDYDLLTINGTLDLSGASSLNPITIDMVTMLDATTAGVLASWDPNTSTTWTGFVIATEGFIDFSADKFAFNTANFLNSLNGTFSVAQGQTGLDLIYTSSGGAAIPEPATAALGLIGLAGLMMRRRRMA